ncbi:T9SS type A sorting domain-containing protein [Halpernia sp.]|uniref:T9SS type A sorting domain-containing protein n=1 Tax=Halpernia sp. TaxID=2782209 RepID=UPI003A903D1E
MRKNLYVFSLVLLGLFLSGQLTYVGNSGLITVSANTLVYNGGGLKVDATGKFNNYGNVMIVGTPSTDKFETAGTNNFVLKLTDPANFTTSSYGQLYISGLTQSDITGNVYKEYRDTKQGTYQQIGLPFYNKTLNTLNSELGKTFSNTRYSQNEILKYDQEYVVARNTNINTDITDPAAYYMLGTLNLDTANPPGGATGVYTLMGKPFAEGISKTLTGAASKVATFGVNGTARNIYNEKFNTYLQDDWDGATPWTGNYGKNIYQYSNPYLTNLDLSWIYKDTPDNDGNYINNIQGIRFSPGVTYGSTTVGSYSTNAQYVTFASGVATGDLSGLIIKPLQTFVIKLTNSTSATLNFDKLRRFKNVVRAGSNYSVTAAKNSDRATSTVKQLGVIAYNAAGEEMGRTYFVVYNNGVTGYNPQTSTQVLNDNTNIIGTYEEKPVEGGFDDYYAGLYWLYINEVNEQDFKGKSVPLSLYSDNIKTLKFEIRENENLLAEDASNLSTGIGFYYKEENGDVKKISQGMSIPTTVLDNYAEYGLYYGKPDSYLATGSTVKKQNRTQVVYNPQIDNYIIRFDPNWKKADVQVYDMSGKLILSKKNVSTGNDFVLELEKETRAYIVNTISEKGEKSSVKIIR